MLYYISFYHIKSSPRLQWNACSLLTDANGGQVLCRVPEPNSSLHKRTQVQRYNPEESLTTTQVETLHNPF